MKSLFTNILLNIERIVNFFFYGCYDPLFFLFINLFISPCLWFSLSLSLSFACLSLCLCVRARVCVCLSLFSLSLSLSLSLSSPSPLYPLFCLFLSLSFLSPIPSSLIYSCLRQWSITSLSLSLTSSLSHLIWVDAPSTWIRESSFTWKSSENKWHKTGLNPIW